jgi:hypothetical protein
MYINQVSKVMAIHRYPYQLLHAKTIDRVGKKTNRTKTALNHEVVACQQEKPDASIPRPHTARVLCDFSSGIQDEESNRFALYMNTQHA